MLQPLKPDVLEYFGLMHDPFGRLRERDFFVSSEFRRALKVVKYAIQEDEIVALVGDVGAGKTETVRMVREAIHSDAVHPVQFVHLVHPDKREVRIVAVVDLLLKALGLDKPAASTQGRTLQLRMQLAKEAADNRFCLVIDEAHRLTGGFLKSLKDLHESSRWGVRPALFSVVLIGHEGLLLRYREVARDVYERLAAGNVASFGHMTPLEVSDYIETRVKAAGGNGLFDKPSRAAVGRLAHTPLAVNAVCYRAMEEAYRQGAQRIGDAVILAAFDRRGLLDHLGLTVREVAAKAGLGETTVRDVLDGKAADGSIAKVDELLRGAVKGLAKGGAA
jgi:type II secretory pathway predicted ATPase ExeA